MKGNQIRQNKLVPTNKKDEEADSDNDSPIICLATVI